MIGTLTGLFLRHGNSVQMNKRLQKISKLEVLAPVVVDLRTRSERIQEAKLRVREVWRQMKLMESQSECEEAIG